MLTNNLRQYLKSNSAPFDKKAIQWYRELLLDQANLDDMTGIVNGILIAYGMCPPCKLQEYYQLAPQNCPTHFMQGTAREVWGDDPFEIMNTTAADWTDRKRIQ